MQGLGIRFCVSEFRVEGLGLAMKVSGCTLQVSGLGFEVQGLGLKV